MGSAYTPGLTVAERTRIEKVRRLPLRGTVLVSVGQAVRPDTVTARAELPGDIVLLRAADKLGVSGEELLALLTKQVGDAVEEGELLAETPGLFGRFFRTQLVANATGTIETVTARTGNMAIRRPAKPVDLLAYMAGTVTEVLPEEGVAIEALGALVQGIFGVGGERHGNLTPLASAVPGSVAFTAGRVSLADYRAAAAAGAVAVIGGSIVDADLRAILGHDIGVAITGEEDLPATLIITEGFGDVPMASRTADLLARLSGRAASVSGATQIRAGVIRPEVIVPDPSLTPADVTIATDLSQNLAVGARVRLIREPYFGLLATVRELPAEPVIIATGASTRVLRAELADGRVAVVPRANVEIALG